MRRCRALLKTADCAFRVVTGAELVRGVTSLRMEDFEMHRVAIEGFLQRAQEDLSLEQRAALRVAIERQRKEGLPVSESVPMLREAARRLANLIIDQLNYAEGDLSAKEIRELEALTWKKLPNP